MKSGQTATRSQKESVLTSKEILAEIVSHVLYLLRGGGAHIGFEDVVKGLPPENRGTRPQGLPFSLWMLLEHMRISQWDILEFCRNPKHVSPVWPDGYWPKGPAPPDGGAWNKSIHDFNADLKALEDLVADPSTDMLSPIPHGEGQTLLREALLAADHNSYHMGQIVLLRRLLGEWKETG
ncbi:MAG: DinB family protein [Armatimonadetes bacterium]|nr:DinB family protein [Armatimonadota bacterium]